MIGKILLAVDGSENASRATEVAAELASRLDAELSIVHVLMHGRPPAELVHMAEVEHLVEEAQAVVAPGVEYIPGKHVEFLRGETNMGDTARVIAALGDQIIAAAKSRCTELGAKKISTLVRAGDHADEILDAAQDFSADMVVVGSRGLGLIRRTVLGSVSQKILHNATCSVVTVR